MYDFYLDRLVNPHRQLLVTRWGWSSSMFTRTFSNCVKVAHRSPFGSVVMRSLEPADSAHTFSYKCWLPLTSSVSFGFSSRAFSLADRHLGKLRIDRSGKKFLLRSDFDADLLSVRTSLFWNKPFTACRIQTSMSPSSNAPRFPLDCHFFVDVRRSITCGGFSVTFARKKTVELWTNISKAGITLPLILSYAETDADSQVRVACGVALVEQTELFRACFGLRQPGIQGKLRIDANVDEMLLESATAEGIAQVGRAKVEVGFAKKRTGDQSFVGVAGMRFKPAEGLKIGARARWAGDGLGFEWRVTVSNRGE
jgi:hypothetical protein